MMAQVFLGKSDITVGDVYHLRRLPGDEPKPKQRRSLFCWDSSDEYDDQDDSDYFVDTSYDSNGPPERVSQAILDRYTAEGLERRITNHPVVVIGLMEDSHRYDSKVLVC
jgi:hypothetical protein